MIFSLSNLETVINLGDFILSRLSTLSKDFCLTHEQDLFQDL